MKNYVGVQNSWNLDGDENMLFLAIMQKFVQKFDL